MGILQFRLNHGALISYNKLTMHFGIATTSLALWDPNFWNLQGKKEMGILNIMIKLQWNKSKGNVFWSEL